MFPKHRVPIVALALFSVACAASGRPRGFTNVSCEGRTMAIIVNQSAEAIEAVAFREGGERVLALAPPGLVSRPFQPPRPEEYNYSRPEHRRQSHWYLREVATRRMIPSRDPKVRADWVCVESDGA